MDETYCHSPRTMWKLVSRHRTFLFCATCLWLTGVLIFLLLMRSGGTGEGATSRVVLRSVATAASHARPLRNRTVASIAEYCNPVEVSVTGDERLTSDVYRLVNVHIVIRHGDRGALPLADPEPRIVCDVHVKSPLLEEFRAHVRSLAKRRHPADSFSQFPYIPVGRYCQPGKLTTIGVLQHLKNGAFLRERYGGALALHDWDDAERVTLKSTVIARTYQSLVAFLYPLLPGFDASRLSIVPVKNNAFCAEGAVRRCDCRAMLTMRQRYIDENSQRLARNGTMQGALRTMARAMNVSLDRARPHALLDQSMRYLCHGAAMPCNARGRCIESAHVDALLHHHRWNGRRLARSDSYQRYSAFKVYPLLLEMTHRLSDVAAGRSRNALTLYSGHDVTLGPLLTALDAYDGAIPPYASRLVVELYAAAGGRHYVRLLYNGGDVTRRVRFCRGRVNADGVCELKHFLRFVTVEMLEDFGGMSYDEACVA
ncbi:PREDICTED: 2-phosphoxylose phosphatase 1-like [Priapulus caudatus]|uniref:2-phosphoxylose phosphatase 1 n=1 Tax=Priapulus caudatus TaxID=37621 RepID=A0ABM1EDN5_PRICU|nr:PREDICTED: 2-phosphoxylose phosphatase 1-like [Priapulus caudatus]XP_014670306.1 PREDICTED: 2-phosphoxylose phosphatase 1-like [Priapulus caudatus]XP_014670307.1 PREDICTED: 2-phosphoxylose phosphatase 1-like [Priapulus caudatus]XP_014670308.1 PREDICTED: 2-phosphoxylose phosphatase 1-like [Priapulus caudatus]